MIDEPQPLPEGHPIREAWVKRIMARQLNDLGAPTWRDRQTERKAPDWDKPMIERPANPV